MAGTSWLLVVEGANADLETGLKRKRALDALKARGGAVRHDSGGRLVVVEGPQEGEEQATASLREAAVEGASLVPLTEGVEAMISDLTPNERLFLEAVKIRNSPGYREMKARQKPGESPEEQAMFTAPCRPGE